MCCSDTPCSTPCADCTCEEEVLNSCEECGNEIPSGDEVIAEGTVYCANCTSTCQRCNTVGIRDSFSSVYINGYSHRERMWCEDCISNRSFVCDCCCNQVTGDGAAYGWDTYCECCRDNYLFWCNRCEEYHRCDDGCEYRCEIDERNHSMTPRIGAKTSRFTLRTIGIEIETGDGADSSDFACAFEDQYQHWGYKEDGSLCDGGRELVSPPLGGDIIGTEFRGVYDLLLQRGVDMLNQSAGTHIHVDFQDIRDFIGEAAGRGNENPLDAFVAWGNLITSMVRMMVEPRRATNGYCGRGFGSRCGESPVPHSSKVMHKGYAAVAVRTRTIEFRIWSVTDKSEVSMARAEFSQKSVDFLGRLVRATTAQRTALMTRMQKALLHLRLGSLTPLKRLFSLSAECCNTLQPFVAETVTYNSNHLKSYGELPAFHD